MSYEIRQAAQAAIRLMNEGMSYRHAMVLTADAFGLSADDLSLAMDTLIQNEKENRNG